MKTLKNFGLAAVLSICFMASPAFSSEENETSSGHNHSMDMAGMTFPNPFDPSTWYDGAGDLKLGETIAFEPLNPAFWGNFMDAKMHSKMHMAFTNPAQYMQLMQPQFFAQFMNPANYMQMMNPAHYVAFMNPNNWTYWMQPGAYMHGMNMAAYMQMMNPAAYSQMMSPEFMMSWMNPATYTDYFNTMNGNLVASTVSEETSEEAQ